VNSSPKDESTRFITIVQQNFRKLLRKHKIALCVIFLAVLFSGLLITGALELLFYLPAGAKIGIIITIALIALITFYFYYRKLHRPSFKDFYHQFGKKHSHPQLSDALDLHYDAKTDKSALHQAAIKQNLGSLNPKKIKTRFDEFLTNHQIYKAYKTGLIAVIVAFIALAGFTSFQPDAMKRLAHMWVSYSPPNPYSYTIEPGTLTLEQGESFTPKINFAEDYPENLSLYFKTDIEDEFRQRNPVSSENQQASFSPISLTTNGSYYFIMDGFRSEEHRITVQLRPRLEQLTIRIMPPDYTRLDTSDYTYPFSQIRAYKGSEIQLRAITNKPVAQISLFRSSVNDSSTLSVADDSTTFRHQWTVEGVDTASFSMSDSAGLSNKNKFRFAIEPTEDQYPFVNLTEPSENLQMKTPENLTLTYEAGDDFGLTGASLHFELQRAFSNNPIEGSVPLPRPAMNQEQSFDWDLPQLEPKPRDVITYWIQVQDNDAYNGSKTGRSQKLTVTFPSMTEYLDELDAKEEEVTKSLEDISESFNQMEQEYEKFKNQLKQNPETTWEQKQQLQQVEEKQKEIDEKVNELNKKFEQIRREIEKSQTMSPETTKAYNELQKLIKEINDPELAKALEELRNSMEQLSPDQMREALENYEFNEELYKERIERTLELFKSLKMNSDLEKMATALEELSKQEQQISESQQSPKENLEQQEAIQEDLQNLQQQVDSLEQNAPEKARDRVRELQQKSAKQMKQTQQELRENMEQLKQEQDQGQQQSSPATKQQQRNIQKQMQQMSQQMRSAKQQMNQQQAQINASALQYIMYSLINLSTNQEELTKETENLPNRSQAFVEKARKESNIAQQFTMLSDSLFQISSEILGFSNQIIKKKGEVEGHLSRAVEMLSERDKSNSTFAQRQSLGGINELATMIASLLDQLQNMQGGRAGSMTMNQFMKQMQKMSGQQQMLNKQIQNLINDIQGNRLSQDQMERLNQMSKQQNQIRKQIQELKREGNFESGDRILSELERMSEQMEDAINDLRGGQLDRQLMQRQENILSRMLSAEKAAQERGKDDRREGTTAEETPPSVPPDVTLEELQQRIRKMLNDPDRTKFTEDYQRLIEQYFELLKQQEKRIGT
jgi:methyl-accepting chemotaxis protein